MGGPLQYHPSLLEKARVPVICLTAKAARDGADNVSAGIQPAAASPGCENKKKKKVWVEANWSEPTVSTPPADSPCSKYWQPLRVSSVAFSAHP